MKKSFNNFHYIELEIFYSEISMDLLQSIRDSLINTYGKVLKVFIGDELELFKQAFDIRRNQYNAEILLKYLTANKNKELALWVTERDIYISGMNFIFGLAQYLNGSVLSIFRLSNKELVEKEAIHEVGHVLGLKHCNNNCVMQYSNSLLEAEIKSSCLCKECREKLML